MAEELKPCPFCGGPMTLKVSRSNGHQIFGSHTKECAFSDISACMQEPSDCEWVADEIIKRWNTRAQLPSRGGEAVAGTLHISHFRENPAMANVDFQLIADLPPGSYNLYTHPADQVAEPDAELVELKVLLPALDDALEDLELHGQHSDQGYRKLKDWYRKAAVLTARIDAKLASLEVKP
jgi:ssDNA-binding Zn-finger/Zn-ribbon topoisomerase 1